MAEGKMVAKPESLHVDCRNLHNCSSGKSRTDVLTRKLANFLRLPVQSWQLTLVPRDHDVIFSHSLSSLASLRRARFTRPFHDQLVLFGIVILALVFLRSILIPLFFSIGGEIDIRKRIISKWQRKCNR